MPNAFATGRGQRNSVVVVTTGIMEILDDEEMEGVIGHELTHIKNRDVPGPYTCKFIFNCGMVSYAVWILRRNGIWLRLRHQGS